MENPRTELSRSSPLPLIAIALAVVAAIGYGVYRLRSGLHEEDLTPPPVADTAPPPAAEPPAGADEAKALLEKASPNALFRGWIAGADLVRRAVTLLEQVALGESPRRLLPAFAPRLPFSVVASGSTYVIAPDSYARYDAFADAVESLDVTALASAYRRLHGVLEASWRVLGHPQGSLDAVTARALRRLAAAPAPEGEVAVRDEDGTWVFADARLERQGEVEKHLLRMGARNERIVQAKARALLDALALPAPVAARAR